jgi:hypothetical protein
MELLLSPWAAHFAGAKVMGGTPSSHPFIDWIFNATIQLLEYPHDYGNPGFEFDMWHDLLEASTNWSGIGFVLDLCHMFSYVFYF